MNALPNQPPSTIITRVGALTITHEHSPDALTVHIFDSARLTSQKHDTIPSSLMAELLLDAAQNCPTCRSQLDAFLAVHN